MSATGLDVFDKTLQTTHIWLDEIMAELGPDRRLAWHVLGAVLRTLRNRLPLDLSAHLSAELPLLVRGAYYEQFQPADQPDVTRSLDAFLQRVQTQLNGARPVNTRTAVSCVFSVLSRHIDAGQTAKTRHSLPEPIRALWPASDQVDPQLS